MHFYRQDPSDRSAAKWLCFLNNMYERPKTWQGCWSGGQSGGKGVDPAADVVAWVCDQ